MAILAVHRHEVLRAKELLVGAQLALTRVSGRVDRFVTRMKSLSVASRCRSSMTRPTDHSLPGIGCELRMTVSSGPTLKFRASPRESFESTASGSPLAPGTDDADFARREAADVFDVDDVRWVYAQLVKLASEFDVGLHRATP